MDNGHNGHNSHIKALQRLMAQPSSAPRPEPRPEPIDRCELCAAPLASRHEHLLDLGSRQLACACTGCALLFDAASGKMRRLPRDSRYLANFDLSGAEWAALGIPVNVAFLSFNSVAGALTAAYPSPAGAVTATVAAAVWASLVEHHPELAGMAPDVEALLLQRMHAPHQAFIAPLDQCYRLTGLIRSSWAGFTGGPEVKRRLAAFCAELRREAREVQSA